MPSTPWDQSRSQGCVIAPAAIVVRLRQSLQGTRVARRRTESVAAAAQQPGSHLTSRDIARAAGVSQATVSNVLNRPELVAAETELRVRKIMDAMGFVVNDSARTLRAGRSRAIGVVTLDLSNPFWGEVTRGIEAAAS